MVSCCQRRLRAMHGAFPALLGIAAGFLSACTDDRSTLLIPTAAEIQVTAPSGKQITSNPELFAGWVKQVGNQNELMIAMKDASAPLLAPEFVRSLPFGGDAVIAIPEAQADAPRRKKPGFAAASPQSLSSVLNVLSAHGIRPYHKQWVLPVYSIRVPDSQLLPLLKVLLKHPNVDFIEANRARAVTLDAGPLGSNPTDAKHDFHNVQGAWDHTRGELWEIGVMDTGMAYDAAANDTHPDARWGFLTIAHRFGIDVAGFVDDYGSCDPFYGSCRWEDDLGHGTQMAGLPGENDNGIGYVGVMPQGLTWSLKIIQNKNITGNPSCPSLTCLEEDDFFAGIDWTLKGSWISVLSMSFSGDFGLVIYNALNDAFYSYDVLLLSSTGNAPGAPVEPQIYPFVMGVGGVDAAGNNVGNDEYQDISGYAGGMTLSASCDLTSICRADGYAASQATSAATAIAAGIAGLVRAEKGSTANAQQVWDILVNTSVGPHRIIDARAAVLATP